MENLQLPSESFQYAFAAHEEARQAAVTANHGYRAKLKFYEEESVLRKWKELMINAPILLHNILFILFAIADMIISWEMIRDIVAQGGNIPEGWETFAVAIFCLLINAWAAVTAHFIGRGWAREVQDWERWNYIFIKNRSQSPVNLVSDTMRKEINSSRIWAFVSGLILIGLVAVIIYYRNMVLAPSEEPDTTVVIPGLQLVMSYLPLAIIVGELFTGDYLWYSIRVMEKQWSRNRNRRKFLKLKERCGKFDQLAVQYSQAAKQKDEIINVAGDLERSHLRFKYLSQQNDDFLDPLDNFKRINFNIKHRTSGKPATHATVFGVLPSGGITESFQTDDEGKVTIPMKGDSDRLISVFVENKEFRGPFLSFGEHYLDLPEYVSSNGVS